MGVYFLLVIIVRMVFDPWGCHRWSGLWRKLPAMQGEAPRRRRTWPDVQRGAWSKIPVWFALNSGFVIPGRLAEPNPVSIWLHVPRRNGFRVRASHASE